MASPSPSRSEVEQSFSIAAGEFTDAEREYLLRKGLIYENSRDETLDISTDVESFNSSNLSRSHLDSLVVFEENERLYADLLNKSLNSENKSPMKTKDSPSQNAKSAEVSLINMSKLSLNEGSVSPGYAYPVTEFEEDKENEFKGPIGAQRVLFKDELEKGRDPLEEIKGIAEQSPLADFEDSEKSQDEASELSDNEICVVPCTQAVALENSFSTSTYEDNVDIVPCTQDVSLQQSFSANTDPDNVDLVPCTQDVSLQKSFSTKTDSDNVDVIPCTQGQNESLNLNQTYTSETLEESLREDYNSTQSPEFSLLTDDGEVSRLNDSSKLPCSQSSTGEAEVSSKVDEFNDSIEYMDYLLKKADEQEAREAREAARQKAADNNKEEVVPSPAKASNVEQIDNPSEVASSESGTDNNDKAVFKTPLKHNRVQLLKNKKVASPSPPRSFANALLQQRGGTKMSAVTAKDKKPVVIPKSAGGPSSVSSSPMSTSTPKRAPPTSIPPGGKKNHTPGRGGAMKTPIAAKVDSGLRSSPFPIGLSPVAKYIYDKPVPSKFARVQSVANSKAATTSIPKASLSRIPLAPTRVSQVQVKPKTPSSASKRPSHSVLRTSTYFNMGSTPPQIVANEKSVIEKKRFQPLQYTGASKVKALNGKDESPRTNDYVAHRHTGLRDESGNASFIQNTIIQKRNIPVQSRLATPKSFSNK